MVLQRVRHDWSNLARMHRAKVPFHTLPAPATRALLSPRSALPWPRGPLRQRHPQVLTCHVHIIPVSHVLSESLMPMGKLKLRQGTASTQRLTAGGAQEGLSGRCRPTAPGWVPNDHTSSSGARRLKGGVGRKLPWHFLGKQGQE